MKELPPLSLTCANDEQGLHISEMGLAQHPHHRLREDANILFGASDELTSAYRKILESIEANGTELILEDHPKLDFGKLREVLDAGEESGQGIIRKLLFSISPKDQGSENEKCSRKPVSQQETAWKELNEVRAINIEVVGWAVVADQWKRPLQKLGKRLPP